jgi:hypothetical protein
MGVMAEETPSLHIDTDWKKQAQAEKRKLAEQQAAAAAAKPPAVLPTSASPAAAAIAPKAGGSAGRRGRREVPVPGFASLVQSVMRQVLYYLGEIAAAGGQPMMDLDLAKHHLDTLAMLEEKTKNNLTAEEQGMLDAALYETRSRFISVASQLLGP